MKAVEASLDFFLVHPYPSFVKYMGSKSKIMQFILGGINEVYNGGVVCDLFSGSASLAGALGQQCPIHSNDIQSYSAILASTYLTAWRVQGLPSIDELLSQVNVIIKKNKKLLGLAISYKEVCTLSEFKEIENLQKSMIHKTFRREWHLFLKYYSGTWWSAEQCLFIDAIREVADRYKGKTCYPLILSCLMYAMAYTSQGTGHYAQYRDAKSVSSMKDILIYRRRSLIEYFSRKYRTTVRSLSSYPPLFKHTVTSLDFKDCLNTLVGGTVYADPPYCFVHYSRFYHVLETLVLYDYPEIQVKAGKIVKGRYRTQRHQSPFSIKSQVKQAFENIFIGVRKARSNLVLSYSNTGMITIDEILSIAEVNLSRYHINLLFIDHQHMTLGRKKDRHRDVKECLLLAKC